MLEKVTGRGEPSVVDKELYLTQCLRFPEDSPNPFGRREIHGQRFDRPSLLVQPARQLCKPFGASRHCEYCVAAR